MSTTNADNVGAAARWLGQVELNVRETLATLLRPPRRRFPWPGPGWIAVGVVLSVGAVLTTMVLFDAWAIASARALPASVLDACNRLTELGLSGWFLWPLGVILVLLAISDTPAMPAFARHVLAAWAVRLGFVFTAIALPGLFVTVIKRLIGRARPFVAGDDIWAYLPFGWRVDYASLPSGHATTAFSVAVSIGALFPSARALVWVYAIAIAASRVVVGAHYPSDVVAGAIVGTVGAWLVRNWFASRRLGFVVRPDGTLHVLPGPGMRRIIKAVARRLKAA